MENMAILVPYSIGLKDLVTTVSGIEEMLEGQGDGGKSPAEELKDWLNAPLVPAKAPAESKRRVQ